MTLNKSGFTIFGWRFRWRSLTPALTGNGWGATAVLVDQLRSEQGGGGTVVLSEGSPQPDAPRDLATV